MASLSDHPTVQAFWAKQEASAQQVSAAPLDAAWLRTLCLEAGADDVGFVGIDDPALADQRADILQLFPPTRTLISMVLSMNRESIRSTARSLANLEFHHADRQLEEIARSVVSSLEKRGVRAVNPSVGFPMEMGSFPGKTWVVSHKPVAVAAGLGQMGLHRNVIHPRLGNHILLITILMSVEVTEYNRPINYNPCLECKLCVAACPVGAIGADGQFSFSACYTHNYREFMGGFNDWVEQIAESKSGEDYRARVTPSESASMWQSLSFGANYKAAYCMAVCPAGEDVIGPFLSDRKGFLKEVVRPLQEKVEPVYVTAGSDAEAYVERRFPHKTVRRVGNGLGGPQSIRSFLAGLPLVFQREQSKGLDAVYHFTFTGKEESKATIVIRDKTIQVQDGHVGVPNISIRVDSQAWLGILAKSYPVLWALVRRKLRIKGSPRLLQAFARCFPS
jgi:Fe-S-cluster-containing hydrogenase component 2